ncbi:hypothetical protein VTJ04DRAFT_6204 [Mycothermus thermophilus]|uniref:uncharacterized protein n=1 Tax=Humicola insolens TaxID=85995 RepID=UPI003744AD0A
MAEMPATNPDPIHSHGEDNVAEELLRVSGEKLCRDTAPPPPCSRPFRLSSSALWMSSANRATCITLHDQRPGWTRERDGSAGIDRNEAVDRDSQPPPVPKGHLVHPVPTSLGGYARVERTTMLRAVLTRL